MTTPGRSPGSVRILGTGLGGVGHRPDSQINGKVKNGSCERCGIAIHRVYGKKRTGYCSSCAPQKDFMEGYWDERVTSG